MRTYRDTVTGYEEELFDKESLWVGDSDTEWIRELKDEEREEHLTNISKLSKPFADLYFDNMVKIEKAVADILCLIKERRVIITESHDDLYTRYLSENQLTTDTYRDQLYLPLDESHSKTANIADRVGDFIKQLKINFPELGEHDEN